jgi:MATE family multidrug resistance protein
MKKARITPQLELAELGPLVRLSIPVALTQLANILMQLVDTYFVGQLGAEALGGIGVGNSIFAPLMIFGMGILFGMDYPVSHAIGAGDSRTANRYLVQALMLASAIALPLTFLMLLIGPLLPQLGIDPGAAAQASQYLGVLAWSLLPTLLFMGFRQFLTSHGSAAPVFAIVVVANIVNALGNYAFVFGNWGFPALGIAGSGWATLCARVFMLVCVVGYALYFSRRRGLELLATPLRFSAEKVREILRLGVPASLQVLLEVGVFAGSTLLAGRLGAVPLAAHQVVLQIASFTFMVPLGISSAAAVRVAQALGRSQPRHAHSAGSLAILLGATVMTFFGLTLFLLGQPILSFFTTDERVVEVGRQLLLIAALFQISDGIQVVATGALRGTAETRLPMLANLVGHWFFGLPLGLTLCFVLGWGVSGIWTGLSIGLTAVAAALLWVWRKKSLT